MHVMRCLLLVLVLILTGCVSVADLPAPVSIYGSIPSTTASADVRVEPVQPETLKNAGGLADPGPLLSRYVRDALASKKPGWTVTTLDGSSPAVHSDIVVTTRLLAIDGGSAALRFWIGFNAGATESTAAVSITDRIGQRLAQVTITERTMCPIGACAESNVDSIQRNLKNLADEIARFVSDPAGYKKEQ